MAHNFTTLVDINDTFLDEITLTVSPTWFLIIPPCPTKPLSGAKAASILILKLPAASGVHPTACYGTCHGVTILHLLNSSTCCIATCTILASVHQAPSYALAHLTCHTQYTKFAKTCTSTSPILVITCHTSSTTHIFLKVL